MILHLNTSKDFKKQTALYSTNTEAVIDFTKKNTRLHIAHIKAKLFFWNLSPTHWYDTFKEIHVDMNEFISPKIK